MGRRTTGTVLGAWASAVVGAAGGAAADQASPIEPGAPVATTTAAAPTSETPAAGTPPAAAPAATPAGLARWLNPATAPFIPIPEIDTAPGSGLTLGVIPTLLSTNDRDEIERIIAPDVIHSQYFGWGSRMRIFEYPSPDTQWSVIGGLKERVEREFDARYATGETRLGDLSFVVEAVYDRSGIPRFFGIGNQTPYVNQTNYLDNQAFLDVSVGRNFTRALQLAYEARFRYVDVLPGVLPNVASTTTIFPELPGIGSEHVLQHTVTLSYDTRDSAIIPQSGERYAAYSGFVSRALDSSVSYSYFGAEARRYWTLGSDVTLACHAAARYMPSAADAPFWALSSLGGDRSVTDEREPLRSAVSDRYIDRNLFASGAEIRARVTGFDAFGTRVGLEVGPFVDTGKVFSTLGTSPLTHLHAAGGLAVRGVASPSVVGYVDVGFGQDGAAVFSGINYPF
jgi:Omp85 superfamily domain